MSGPAEDGPDDGAGPAADAVTDVAGSIVIGGDHGGAAADGTREHGRSLSAVTAPGASSPDASSRNRMAAAVRRIISSAVAAQLEDATVVAATETLEGVADLLESVSGPDRLPRSQPYMESQPQDFFPTSPIIGYANPISPPVTISVVDGVDGGPREIRGTVNFGYPYEGPPTCVHGGVIAEVFDELLGAASIVAGNPGMTGTLTVRYRKPTPLRTDLRLEARCVESDGRKIIVRGAIYHGEVLTAEAEGIFIIVRPAQFMAIADGTADTGDPVILAAMRAEAVRATEEYDGPSAPAAT